MSGQGTTAVIGAGVIGSAIAYTLAREGRDVLLIDRAAPGEGGASFGNAGHVATEWVAPLPSVSLLFGFWRELFAFGGALHVPARRIPAFLPWAARFARAAFQRAPHTKMLAPFVRPAVGALETLLRDIGRSDLLRRHGHYEIWLNSNAPRRARAQARAMELLEVATQPAPAELLAHAQRAAGARQAAGLWFPQCAHVLDPLEVVRAFATAARHQGARVMQCDVAALEPAGHELAIIGAAQRLIVGSAIVCAGAWSATLLRPFRLRVPLEAARGYHVEIPDGTPLVDAPLLYSDHDLIVTPMAGRLRASSYMEFAGADAPADPRKPARLRTALAALGYSPPENGSSWVGPRPVLPDYLPAIGRIAGMPNIGYAFGHQHIGLTLSGITALTVADLLAGRRPRIDISAFDLSRFN